MSTASIILEGLREIAKQQGGKSETIYGKGMIYVNGEEDGCVYALLEEYAYQNRLRLPPGGDAARTAFAFAILLKLKHQKLVYFNGTPRWGVWVAIEGAPR